MAKKLPIPAIKALLNGARLADIASVEGMPFGICRNQLHRFCQKTNPAEYERIAIEAVQDGQSSPLLSQLRKEKHLFIGEDRNQAPAEHQPVNMLETVIAYTDQIKRNTRVAIAAASQNERDYQCDRLASIRQDIEHLASLAGISTS